MGEMRNAYKIFDRKLEGNRPLRISNVNVRIILKWRLKKRCVRMWTDSSCSWQVPMVGSCEQGNKPSVSVNAREFLD
jgi:hypothetical protein